MRKEKTMFDEEGEAIQVDKERLEGPCEWREV